MQKFRVLEFEVNHILVDAQEYRVSAWKIKIM